MKAVLDYIDANAGRYVRELMDLLRIPSISADPAHKQEVARCADLVAGMLSRMGFAAAVEPSEGHPFVYGEWLKAAGAPTLLVYGHYDVQPADPLDQWESPPFEPAVRGENLHARGATDDKGQLFTYIKAAEAYFQTRGSLPLNVKFLLEGEEEIGSPHIDAYVGQNRQRLTADYVAVSDSHQFAPGLPAITYGLRGLAYLEVIVRSVRQDLHSGSFGGSIANPVQVLADMLARLKDEQGRVTLPGYYDRVRPLEDWEAQAFARLPFDEEQYRKGIGARKLTGEIGCTTLERRWARPTLDVNGIYGGYAGAGAKTIIPATAGAKVSMRLVPDQDPEEVAQSFQAYVTSLAPDTVEVEIKRYSVGKPVVLDTRSPGMQAAVRALEAGFGATPVFIREGGSIPVIATFKEALGVDSLLLGYGLPDDNNHGPNEKFHLGDFHRGIRTSALLFHELSRI